MGTWIRRADVRLVNSATRNAAIEVAARDQRQLEHARAMRDLRRLLPAQSFTPMTRHRVLDSTVR